MASKINSNVLVPFGVVIGLMIVGNFWLSTEMKTLERNSILAPSLSRSGVVSVQTSASTVVIDPANDPMAPVAHPVVTQPAQPPAKAEPFYEPSTGNSTILAQ